MTITDEQLAALEGHTPGPWEAIIERESSCRKGPLTRIWGRSDNGPCFIGDIYKPDANFSQNEANATLIAKAPEMRLQLIDLLAEVKRLRALLDYLQNNSSVGQASNEIALARSALESLATERQVPMHWSCSQCGLTISLTTLSAPAHCTKDDCGGLFEQVEVDNGNAQ